MRTINRSAIVVRYKEPYIRWAAELNAADAKFAQDLRTFTTVYLVPWDQHGREDASSVAEHFGGIFDHGLSAWCDDESRWPPVRDRETFHKWFEVVAESVVVDLGGDSLHSEEM